MRGLAFEDPSRITEGSRAVSAMATDIDNRPAIEALRELAAEYEGLAVVLERDGRPDGRHAEHWTAAERELADGDEHEC